MIIANLKGGIGNQLFQYALGRHLSIKNKAELKLDISGLDRAEKVGNIYRTFDLYSFNITAPIANEDEIKKLKYPYGRLSKIWRTFSFKVLRKHNLLFDPKILTLPDNTYLDGYWQSPKFFENIREVLIKDLTLANPPSPAAETYHTKIQNTNSVSLHVRRGDYIKNPVVLKEFGICSNDYYTKAVKHILNSVNDPVFFVFSDDVDWVKENISLPDSTVYVQDPNLSAVEELILMSKCKHNIIANSSFSWWGAWLSSNNTSRVVIAPTPWFDHTPYDKDLIPKSWIQIQK